MFFDMYLLEQQKQPFAGDLKNRCAYKSRKFTHVLESLFNKIEGLPTHIEIRNQSIDFFCKPIDWFLMRKGL